jgi:ABC-2 type transport system permease protein
VSHVLLVARRDLGAYLNGYGGYLIIAAMLFILGVLFQALALEGGAKYSHEVLEQFFYNAGGVVNIAAILLTMRSLAEERAQGTDVLLATSTASETQVVVGKYLAAMGVLALMLALSVYMPLLIFVNGKVSLAHLGVGYLGLMVMASATASIGLATSAMFRSQVAAGIVAGVILATLIVLWMLSENVAAPLDDVLAYAAYWDKHFEPFKDGQLHLRDVVYYGSITFLGLLGATKVLEGRRWQ